MGKLISKRMILGPEDMKFTTIKSHSVLFAKYVGILITFQSKMFPLQNGSVSVKLFEVTFNSNFQMIIFLGR